MKKIFLTALAGLLLSCSVSQTGPLFRLVANSAAIGLGAKGLLHAGIYGKSYYNTLRRYDGMLGSLTRPDQEGLINEAGGQSFDRVAKMYLPTQFNPFLFSAGIISEKLYEWSPMAAKRLYQADKMGILWGALATGVRVFLMFNKKSRRTHTFLGRRI